jgi:hypothetical protein
MPTTKRLGYICTCGRQIRLGGGGVGTADKLEAWRDEKRREGWAMMAVHSEADGGCGAAMGLEVDNVILIEIQKEQSREDHL